MGVYLPNVDMPKDDKAVTIQICPDGSIWQQYRGTVPNTKAVPVHTPHGRMIDADKMRESIRTQTAFLRLIGGELAEIAETLEKGFLQEIDNAPTIIPAEDLKLSATIKCGGAVTCAVASEEVYRGK